MKRFALLLCLAGCGPCSTSDEFTARLSEAQDAGKASIEAERDLMDVRRRRDCRGPIRADDQKQLDNQEAAVKRRRDTTYQREQDLLRRLADDLDAAVTKSPDNVDLRLLRMRARDAVDPPERSNVKWVDAGPQILEDAAKVLEARPGDPTALALKAGVLRRRGKHAQARPVAAEALRKDPRHPRALAEAGLCAFALNDFDAAGPALQAAYEQLAHLPAHARLEVIARSLEMTDRRAYWAHELQCRARDESAMVPRVKVSTSKGDLVLELFEDDAPNTVANFVQLVESGFYDGLSFHIVLPGHVQAGDASTRPGGRKGVRNPTPPIRDEPSSRRHFRGSLAMARRPNARDSATSEVYITREPSEKYDGKFTVFGRVIEGWDALDEIEKGDVVGGAIMLHKRDHPYRPEYR